MKNQFFVLCLFFIYVTVIAQENEYVKLNGPYLGQKPPGLTPEVFAPGIISKASQDICISFTPDGNEVYYTVGGPPHSIILNMNLVNGKWTSPRVAPFSGQYSSECQLSPDGKRIYFCAGIPESGKGDPKGNWDIWTVEKKGNTWGEPVRIPAPLASDKFSADCPTVALSGNLYFYSANYPGGFGKGDIYVSRFKEGNYSEPENLGKAINGPEYDMDPFIAPDESYIIFSSIRPGGSGDNDLYISFRNNEGKWTDAVNMGPKINSYAHEIHPFVTRDGKYLFFCSKRRIQYPRYSETPLTLNEKEKWLQKPGNEFEDIYWVDASFIEELSKEALKDDK